MAARPNAKGQGATDDANKYEQEREERIRRNKAKIAALGLLEQRTLLEASFRIVKKAERVKKEKVTAEPSRASSRLKGSTPENEGLADDFVDSSGGRVELPKESSITAGDTWAEVLKERRCDSQGRGSLYDSKAGITCHFCRQKKLCGEPDCPRCSERNPELQCIGKSECSRCASANGRFCRACLLIRYGFELEEVRQEMAAGTWLCPHCHEEDHPDEGWICNSSICMTRRGLKPTGIAIYDAQQRGFPSVAHFVQARLQRHNAKEKNAAEDSQKVQTDDAQPDVGAPALQPKGQADRPVKGIDSVSSKPKGAEVTGSKGQQMLRRSSRALKGKP